VKTSENIMRKVYLAGAVRTPIGCLNGALASVGAVELGRICACAG